MSSVRNDLLRPSLTQPDKLAAAPYSLQTGFLSAFFGGPLAAALLLVLNARRIGRLKRDAVWAVAIALLFVAWLMFIYKTQAGMALQSQLEGWLGQRASALVQRLMGLLAYLGAAFLQRREQRSADLFGLPRPNGWIAGIGTLLAGLAATAVLTVALG